jgi:hypothetical protein
LRLNPVRIGNGVPAVRQIGQRLETMTAQRADCGKSLAFFSKLWAETIDGS